MTWAQNAWPYSQRVEIIDFRAESHGQRAMRNYDAIGLTHTFIDQFLIERNDGAQIEHFDRYTSFSICRASSTTSIPNYLSRVGRPNGGRISAASMFRQI